MGQYDFEHKTINDPVHGSIKVSAVELEVINSISFQRLRGLKQLGLADLVFPGATHTRFAHSIGVLHIVSQMLNAIERNFAKRHKSKEKPFNDGEKQKIRLAALLHDIGHLPLSHAMEQPIQRSIQEISIDTLVKEEDGNAYRQKPFGELDQTSNAGHSNEFSHERYGMELLKSRDDLKKALGEYNDGNEIGHIFNKSHPKYNKYSQFVTGTFDADRIDFLLRDSMAAGVSYGNIDINYLLDNINYDKESGHLYVDYSGIHSLEHFIVARYFLYNVTYHKTVMGFELLAKHAYYEMMKDDSISVPTTENDFKAKAKNDEEFFLFNDSFFWSKLIEWKPTEEMNQAVKESLIYRKPPLELFSERTSPRISSKAASDITFSALSSSLYSNSYFSALLDKFGLSRSHLFLLENKIKFEELSPETGHDEDADAEKEWALCRVFYNGKVRKLIDVNSSIVAQLSRYNTQFKRLYYLPVNEDRPDRSQIREEMLNIFS